jgi:general secretion pathway protein G
MKSIRKSIRRVGMTLLEMLAVVTLMGILAIIVVPRFSTHSVEAKKNACFVNKGNIEVQCQLWFRQKGTAPANNLSDIGADKGYFPEGAPKCPVDGSTYTINTSTMRVSGHAH